MSDLLNQASLVMIPSGYKEDVVYSQIPTSGSGDLSFTRASNGTRVNSAGLVEVVPWNLLQQSETFDNAAWSKDGGMSVSTNTTIAPNGTTTADTLDDQNSGAYGNIEQNFVFVAGVYTFSIYIKKTSGSLTHYPGLEMCSKGTYLILNTTTGAYVESGGTNYTVNVENVGDYWRVSITANTSGGTQIIGVWPAISSNGTSISPSATGSNIFWGAQINIGSTAKPYFPTTDRLNVPRLTYQNGGGGCPSLLLEKQSTNLVSYSEQFDNAWWTKGNGSITANATTSPDGTTNADKFAEDSTNNNHYFGDDTTSATSGQLVTFTIFAKASERSWIAMRLYNGNGSIIGWYNIGSGTLGTIGGGGVGSITSMGNGWYRCALTITMASSSVFLPYVFSSTGDTVLTYTGTSGSGFFVWGAQAEISSYPTSYIPTTSSSATRVADVAQKTGISSLIGQTSGTIFLDYNLITASQDIVVMNAVGLPNNDIAIIFIGNSLEIYCFNNFIEQFRFSLNGYKNTNRYKIAIGYSNNDVACYINGTLVGTDTSCTFNITDSIFYTSADYNAHKINQSVLFKTRLTNAELVSLTTI